MDFFNFSETRACSFVWRNHKNINTYSAWITLYVTWTRTYSRLLYSQSRLKMNRIPYSFPQSADSTCRVRGRIDSPCECEHNIPDSLEQQFHLCLDRGVRVTRLHVEYAEQRIKYGILSIFNRVCEYIHLEYVHIHGIYRIHQAEYGIHVLVVAQHEYVNIYSTCRVTRLRRVRYITRVNANTTSPIPQMRDCSLSWW